MTATVTKSGSIPRIASYANTNGLGIPKIRPARKLGPTGCESGGDSPFEDCVMHRLLSVVCLFAGSVTLAGRTSAEDWPGWRGPNGSGITTEKNLPVRWSAKENVRWKVPLHGAGVSTPVVWGERIYLTAS